MARRRHKRHNPKARYKVRHVVLKKNPRRRRRNPLDPLQEIAKAEAARAEAPLVYGPPRPKRGYRTKQKKRVKAQQQKTAAVLRKRAEKLRKGAKGKGISAITRRAQAHRLSAIASVLAKRGKGVQKSPLVKAMTIKANPGVGGVVDSLKIIAPVAGVGVLGLVGMARVGRMVADAMLFEPLPAGAAEGTKPQLKKGYLDKDGKPTMLASYGPALATTVLTAGAFVGMTMANVAPKWRFSLAFGGLLGAAVQALGAAAASAPEGSILAKAKNALSLGEYTTVGSFGEYTTVGSGIFRGVGEYTTVGDAHPFRPRNFADNRTEFAPMGMLGEGADNRTEFAPGEGGIFAKTSFLERPSRFE